MCHPYEVKKYRLLSKRNTTQQIFQRIHGASDVLFEVRGVLLLIKLHVRTSSSG